MQFVLVDLPYRTAFYPFTLTRSLTEIRVGMMTIQERWEKQLNNSCEVYTEPYLQGLYATNFLNHGNEVVFINATCIPNQTISNAIVNLESGEHLINEDGVWIASKTTERHTNKIISGDPTFIKKIPASFIKNAVHLLELNIKFIQSDFEIITSTKITSKIDASNRLICPENIFVEEGAILIGVSLNASAGPIYIGKDALVMEGVAIRGPFVLGEKSVIKMNTSIYGATTVGPFCTIGGEIKNSIILGYSNKAHEGYLGDSIIGYWCNLGAGTTNSNVKNTAGPIQIWNQYEKSWITVGNKMGMLVGDYTRFAIQSCINTGAYIGISSNIFGNGLLPKVIPNFSWGTTKGYILEKALDDIDNWKAMKGSALSAAEKQVLTTLFHME